MTEKPILFNTAMVKAILEGRKTQTRRLVKDIPLCEPYFTVDEGIAFVCDEDGEWHKAEAFSRIQPGDILWVRETWVKDVGRYMYRANYSDTEKFYMNGREIKMVWRPSIHMPKAAARLFLRVTKVRCERLQDISSADIDAEGCKEYAHSATTGEMLPSEPIWFRIAWNKTVKPSDLSRYGWDANPWVWVIEFERCEKP